MFFGFDLKELFMFPVKDEQARKYLLIGALVALAGFFIPILPYLVLIGYSVQIARQVLRGEAPHMIPWEDWSGMLKDGAKLLGVRLVYSIPILIVASPLMLGGIAMPFMAESMNSSEVDTFIAIFSIIMMGGMCILIPISLPLAVIIPVAEMHVVDNDDFAAGFRFKAWWGILRANLGGFIAAFAIYYVISMVLAIGMQILIATLILACLLFILMPAMTIYLTLIMYTTVAIAYRDGRAKLNKPTKTEFAA
jgi:hypothetical protein